MADAETLVHLKVLSPSPDVPADIVLPDLPAATTVGELRRRLQGQIASSPAPDRMRLIYRGRVVVDDAASLADVFGLENIRASTEQTLHLVLRELPAPAASTEPAPEPAPASPHPSPAPRSALSPPPDPLRAALSPPHVQVQVQPGLPPLPGQPGPQQTNPFRDATQPRLQPHHPHAHAHPHHHHHHHHHTPQSPQPQPPQNPQEPQSPPGVRYVAGPALSTHIQQQIAQVLAQNRNDVAQALAQSLNPAPPQAPDGQPNPPAPAGTNPTPTSNRTVRTTETVGPNGQRVTVTWNTNITMGPPESPLDQSHRRAEAALATATRELQIARTLLGSVPPARIMLLQMRMRFINGGLNAIQRYIASMSSNPLVAQHPDYVNLQHSISDLRGQVDQLDHMLDHMDDDTSFSTQAPIPGTTPTPQVQQQQGTNTGPEQLYIVGSPEGPVAILFDPRGTYTTAPTVPTLPFQTFTEQFAANRQTIAELGQQIAQNTYQVHNQLAALRPPQNGQPGAAQPAAGQGAPHNQHQNQNANQNANQAAGQNQPGENDRLALWAGHAWLMFKLLCFMYIFAGHGGWYRPIMVGVISAIVYLVHLGMFEGQFNHIRQHFEALLLPLADRHGLNPNGQPQNPEQPQDTNRNPTPQQAAQRLMQQRQNQQNGLIRQSVRSVERAVALFVASLWPGIGERMVQTQEERDRAARAAEEADRQRLEEENRKLDEANANVDAMNAELERLKREEKAGQDASEGEAEASSSKAKGKQRAVGEEAEAAEAEASSAALE